MLRHPQPVTSRFKVVLCLRLLLLCPATPLKGSDGRLSSVESDDRLDGALRVARGRSAVASWLIGVQWPNLEDAVVATRSGLKGKYKRLAC